MDNLVTALIHLIPELHEEIRWRVFDGQAESMTQEINAILLGLKPPMDLEKLKGEWPDKWANPDTVTRGAKNTGVLSHIYLMLPLLKQLKASNHTMTRRVNEILTGRHDPYNHPYLIDQWPSKWKRPN